MKLAAYADPDGTNIWVSAQTLANDTGFSIDTVYRLLEDMKELNVIRNHERRDGDGPWIRSLNLDTLKTMIVAANSNAAARPRQDKQPLPQTPGPLTQTPRTVTANSQGSLPQTLDQNAEFAVQPTLPTGEDLPVGPTRTDLQPPSPSPHVERQKPTLLAEQFHEKALAWWKQKHPGGKLMPVKGREAERLADLIGKLGMNQMLARFSKFAAKRHQDDTYVLVHFVGGQQ